MGRFLIDPDRSRVWVDARSTLHPIHSESRGLRGFFQGDLTPEGRLEPLASAAAALELPVEEMKSGNPLLDREMRRRVDARRHPTITGTLTRIEPAGEAGRYRVTGEVTFRGVTRTCQDEMVIAFVDPTTIRLEGVHTFDVRDFGMEPPRILALRVYPEVSVGVDVVAQLEGHD